MTRGSAPTRDHVLHVAHELFYWNGIRATGVDLVAARAGIAPTTLYRLFASKDGLVNAYVEQADTLFRSWFTAAVEGAGPDPVDRILAVFDAQSGQLEPEVCRGCAFLMTLAEFPDQALPAHRSAIASKTWLRTRLGELTDDLAAQRPLARPAELADWLTLIFEGANAATQSLGADGPSRRAGRLAAATVAHALDAGDPSPRPSR